MSRYAFFQKILSNPFRYYCRAASITFGLVSTTNLATTIVGYGDPTHYRRDLIKNDPDVYFAGLLAKGLYYGSLKTYVNVCVAYITMF